MKFSLIVPVYNAAPWLRACLDSVIAQTFADFECLCIDDGSTDGSGEILREYALADPRIKVIRQPNRGEGAARNAGLDAARGEWICFLDADDVLNDRFLQVFELGCRTDASVELVAVGSMDFADPGPVVWPSSGDVDWKIFACGTRMPKEVFSLALWMCAYRADLLSELRFGDLKIGADRVFFSRVAERVGIAALADWIGYAYRQHAGSAVHAPLTAETFISDVRHAIAVMEIMAASKKAYADEVWRKHGLWFVERFVFAFFRLPEADRTRIWPEYLSSMRRACVFRQTPATVRCLLRIVLSARSQRVMRVLCSTVYWMKRHGVNRRLAVHVK